MLIMLHYLHTVKSIVSYVVNRSREKKAYHIPKLYAVPVVIPLQPVTLYPVEAVPVPESTILTTVSDAPGSVPSTQGATPGVKIVVTAVEVDQPRDEDGELIT